MLYRLLVLERREIIDRQIAATEWDDALQAFRDALALMKVDGKRLGVYFYRDTELLYYATRSMGGFEVETNYKGGAGS